MGLDSMFRNAERRLRDKEDINEVIEDLESQVRRHLNELMADYDDCPSDCSIRIACSANNWNEKKRICREYKPPVQRFCECPSPVIFNSYDRFCNACGKMIEDMENFEE